MLRREWYDQLYDAMAARCETGSPDLAKDYLARVYADSKKLWGGGPMFWEVRRRLSEVGKRICRDYKVHMEL